MGAGVCRRLRILSWRRPGIYEGVKPIRRLNGIAIFRTFPLRFYWAQSFFDGMRFRVSTILLLTAFLLLLMHPAFVPFAQPGAGSSKLVFNPLQDDLLTSTPQQEKRNEDFSVRTEEASMVVHLERFAVIHHRRVVFICDLPALSSLLVYTQTTSSFL